MIVRGRPSRLDLIFALRGSIVPAIAADVVALITFGCVIVWLQVETGMLPELDAAAYTVFGIALSLFLGFRNNAAYDRWWEARTLWGGLLADLRSFAREVHVFVDESDKRKSMLTLALAFVHLHRVNLRGLELEEETKTIVGDLVKEPHPPCAALDRIASEVQVGTQEGIIDGFGKKALAERLASISLGQAGCERIAGTPLPYVYSLLIYRTTYIYCLLLPLALAEPLGWMTPLFVGIVAYMFLGLAEVTEELNHPFAVTTNGLALDAICREAERSLAPHLGNQVQQRLEAKDYFLS